MSGKIKQLFSDNNISYIISMVFLVSAISKVVDFNSFVAAVIRLHFFYRMPTIKIAASLFITLEITTAILLRIQTTRLTGLYVSLSMISFFSVLSVNSLINKRHFSCGCFGALSSNLNGFPHMMILILMMVVCITAIIKLKEYKNGDRFDVFRTLKIPLTVTLLILSGLLIFVSTKVYHTYHYNLNIGKFIEEYNYANEYGEDSIRSIIHKKTPCVFCFVPIHKPVCDYRIYNALNDIAVTYSSGEISTVVLFLESSINSKALYNIKKINRYQFECVRPIDCADFKTFIFKSNPYCVVYSNFSNGQNKEVKIHDISSNGSQSIQNAIVKGVYDGI